MQCLIKAMQTVTKNTNSDLPAKKSFGRTILRFIEEAIHTCYFITKWQIMNFSLLLLSIESVSYIISGIAFENYL